MIRSTIAAVLLFAVMVCTAVVVSHAVPQGEFKQGPSVAWQISRQPQSNNSSNSPAGSILDASHPAMKSYGEGSGFEENEFVIAFGLTFILCFAVGFWKYHQILEQRKQEEDAANEQCGFACKSGACSQRPGGKETR